MLPFSFSAKSKALCFGSSCAAWPGLQSTEENLGFEEAAVFAKFMETTAELENHTDDKYCEYGCYAEVSDSQRTLNIKLYTLA